MASGARPVLVPAVVALLAVTSIVALCAFGVAAADIPGLVEDASSSFQLFDVGFSAERGSIAAFGDFNADKFTDAFVVGENGDYVAVYLYNATQGLFLEGARLEALANVTSVVPGDFDRDGDLDALIIGLTTSAPGSAGPAPDAVRYYHLYLGDDDGFDSVPVVVNGGGSAHHALDQPFVVDATNTLRLDLFFPSDAVVGGRALLHVDGDDISSDFGLSDAFDSPTDASVALGPLRTPGGHASVDLTGDCLAEAVIVSCGTTTNGDPAMTPADGAVTVAAAECVSPTVEVWVNGAADGFTLEADGVFQLPAGAGVPSFEDMDGDGAIDMVVPVCLPAATCAQTNEIHIFYNAQTPYCVSFLFEGSDCRSTSDLCGGADAFGFGDTASGAASGTHVVVSGDLLPALRAREWRAPPRIRIGDYDLDGHGDALVVGAVTDDEGTTQWRAEIWRNAPCSTSTCADEAVEAGRRTLVRADLDSQVLAGVNDVYAATWFDIGENGAFDVVLLSRSQTPTSDGAFRSIHLVENSFHRDAYLLKALATNGVCAEWCPTSPAFPLPKPFGVNYVGATFAFTYSDINANPHFRTASQLMQSSYLALQMPYVMVGLGRTSNYIDEFYVGVNSDAAAGHSNKYICLMPNSQLVAVPFPRDTPSAWLLELYVEPSSDIVTASIIMGGWAVLTLALVAVLHWREVQRDRSERKQMQHLFHFDAM